MTTATPGQVATYFGYEGAPVFGVFHGAAKSPTLAVLLLSPFGAEDMSAHRGWRDFAQSLADAGLPCLRFDYPGTGDSYPLEQEEDHLGAWIAASNSAVEWLRAVTGVESVALVGLRMGCLIASELARTRADVAALVTLAPLRSGQSYVRELKMLASATQVETPDGARTLDPTNGLREGAIFAAGFVLNAATCDALRRLKPPTQLHTRWIAVIDREEMPLGPDALRDLEVPVGSHKAYTALPGFGPMMLTAHQAVPPLDVYAHARKALVQVAQAVPQGARPVPGLFRATAEVTALARVLHETAVESIGPWGMQGILVSPANPRRRNGHAVLVLNSSAERRIGPNGMWVKFARDRASRGDVVLRLDLPGLGESSVNAGDEGHPVYPMQAMAYIEAALSWLHRETEGATVSVVGLCSGAYHALRATVEGLPVKRAFIINPFVFRPQDDMRIDLAAQGGQAKAIAGNAVRNMRDPKRWAKLLRGQVDVRTILGSIWRRGTTRLLVSLKRAGRALKIIPHLPVTRDLQKAIKRKVHLHFLFASTDPGATLIREETDGAYDHLLRKRVVTEEVVSGADHTFSNFSTREQMLDLIHDRLDRAQQENGETAFKTSWYASVFK